MNEGGVLRAVEQELTTDRQREAYVQAIARSVVDRIGNGGELLLAAAREVSAIAVA